MGDFNFAARLGGRDEPLSTQMYLPVPTTKSLASFFSPQVHHIEAMLDTGKTSYPVERTLLTTGLTAAGLDSRAQEDEVIQTPHLHFDYTASTESTYWRT